MAGTTMRRPGFAALRFAMDVSRGACVSV